MTAFFEAERGNPLILEKMQDLPQELIEEALEKYMQDNEVSF
jgi:hypothetical protein